MLPPRKPATTLNQKAALELIGCLDANPRMKSSVDFPPAMNSNTTMIDNAPMITPLFIEEKGGIKPKTQAAEQTLRVPTATARAMRGNLTQLGMVIC